MTKATVRFSSLRSSSPCSRAAPIPFTAQFIFHSFLRAKREKPQMPEPRQQVSLFIEEVGSVQVHWQEYCQYSPWTIIILLCKTYFGIIWHLKTFENYLIKLFLLYQVVCFLQVVVLNSGKKEQHNEVHTCTASLKHLAKCVQPSWS